MVELSRYVHALVSLVTVCIVGYCVVAMVTIVCSDVAMVTECSVMLLPWLQLYILMLPWLQSVVRVIFHERRLQYMEREQLTLWRQTRPGERILDIGIITLPNFHMVLVSFSHSFTLTWFHFQICLCHTSYKMSR